MMLIFLFVLLLLLEGDPAIAAVVQGGSDYYLGTEGVVEDDLYVAGGNIEIRGVVQGDITAAGGNIYTAGKISQDAQLAGGHLRIEGQIGDDLRAAGGMLYVGGIVRGDAFLAGGHITVGPEAVLRKDIWIAGNDVLISGSLEGEVRIAANSVTLNGKIAGPIFVQANKVNIGDKAVIRGPVYYSAPREAAVAPGARVEKGLQFSRTEAAPVSPGAFFTFACLIKAAAVTAAAVLFYLIFRKWTSYFVLKVSRDFAPDLLRGLVLFFIIPIFSILAIVTVVLTIPGIIAFLVYGLFLIAAMLFSGIVLGAVAAKYVFSRPDYELNWKTVVFGVLALQLIGLIPIFGWLASLVFFLPAFGGLFHVLYQKAWQKRTY